MDIILRVASYTLLFALGAYLRNKKIIKEKQADKLLQLLFYIGLPITVFGSIASTNIQLDSIYLPIISIAITLISGLVAYIIGKSLKIKPKQQGILVVSTMIMNTGLTLPYFGAFYGQEGVALFSLFDLGNIITLCTAVYIIALKYGHQEATTKNIIKKIATTPLIYVIIAAFALKAMQIQLPAPIIQLSGNINLAMFMVVMFTLGLFFELKIHKPKLVALAIATRYITGFILGYIIVEIFNIQGIERAVIITAAASPNGYTTLIYARIAKLDHQYAASTVSLSLIIGLVLIPILLYAIK